MHRLLSESVLFGVSSILNTVVPLNINPVSATLVPWWRFPLPLMNVLETSIWVSVHDFIYSAGLVKGLEVLRQRWNLWPRKSAKRGVSISLKTLRLMAGAFSFTALRLHPNRVDTRRAKNVIEL